MEIKRKIKTTTTAAAATATSTIHCCCCSRHILIAFVGMAVLIVSYGVNTVQMSAGPLRNGSSSNISVDNKNSIVPKILWKKYVQHVANRNSKNNNDLQTISLPTTPTFPANTQNDSTADSVQFKSNSNQKEFTLNGRQLRKARFFGLFGSNFSLSYNLTAATGASAGNITVVAPAPAYYYYAPAPPYAYYDPYSYYNPYAGYAYGFNNPYAGYAYGLNNPYAGYGYYG